MIRSCVLFAAALALAVEWPQGNLSAQSASALPQQQPAPGRQGAGRAGRGGMRASQALFDAQCSGCHGGTDGTLGRAPNLFDAKWLARVSDGNIEKIIRNGIPNSEMSGFLTSQLSDQQIFELTAFLRTQSVNIAPKVEFVADPDGKVIASEKQKFRIEVLTRDLETPWGMTFLPDRRLLLTERGGHIRIYDKGKLSAPVKGTPVPHVQQDGGYLDITAHPRYARNGWIYLAYSEDLPGATPPAPTAGSNDGSGRRPQVPSNTVIVRGKINAQNEWTDQQLIFRSPARLYTSRGEHYGCRFIWDRQGHLFFTLGERGVMQNAQDLMDNPLGKIHRINDDGSVPKDNPFVNREGADKTIWSYGHRNPEGLAWDPVTGKLWESEHGPTGGDEINVIQPGHNYGWGVISDGIQPGITERSHEGMEQPIVYYTPSIAPAGISFYTGDKYPGWKNTSLFVGGLRGQQLRRLEISGDKVIHQEVVFAQYGRVRNIVQGPDGYFYIELQNPTGVNGISVAASTPGMLIRLIPLASR
ncbi:MAG TPA: PQQ-dependent sugar dehydrogenase [Bryobacteraceae bacterium]|nr:PQQ-dependent sugar dehydrogenase [Bryobacteraceae bacterium]